MIIQRLSGSGSRKCCPTDLVKNGWPWIKLTLDASDIVPENFHVTVTEQSLSKEFNCNDNGPCTSINNQYPNEMFVRRLCKLCPESRKKLEMQVYRKGDEYTSITVHRSAIKITEDAVTGK